MFAGSKTSPVHVASAVVIFIETCVVLLYKMKKKNEIISVTVSLFDENNMSFKKKIIIYWSENFGVFIYPNLPLA